MVAHAAFTRSAREVVLNAIAFEVADSTIVHLHRDINDERAFRMAQGFNPESEIAEVGRDAIDLTQVGGPWRCTTFRSVR